MSLAADVAIITPPRLAGTPAFAEVVRLYLEAFTGPPRFEQWTAESVAALVQDHEERGAWACLAQDSVVLGFALFLPLARCALAGDLIALGIPREALYLSNIAVSETARGKGIGACLLRAAEQQGRQRGFTQMGVRCREDAVAIQALLRKRGYRQVASYVAETAGARAQRLLFVGDL